MTPLAAFGPPDGLPSPATPAGSSKPTAVALSVSTRSDAGRVLGHGLPAPLWKAVAAAGKSGQACPVVHWAQAEVSLAATASCVLAV